MNSTFKARIVGLVAICAMAGMGFGAPAAGAATRPNADFAGSYKLFYEYEGSAFLHTWVILTEDHGGSDQAGDTVSWTSLGKKVTITFKGASFPAIYTGVQTKAGIAKKTAPGDVELGNGKSGTWYAKLVPPAP